MAVNKRDTSRIGDISEMEVAVALVRSGRAVLRPLSSACRYDMLLENKDGTFTRVQCKTGVLRNGSVVFRLYRVSGHDTRRVPYLRDIDAYGVYCPALERCYLVPVAAVAGQTDMACLRLEPARNGQVRGVRVAADYEIKEIKLVAQ
jgi:hypothetical protein